MKACIVSIGNELLNGHTVDTNTSWLSGKLFEMGISTVGSWTVPDEEDRIVQVLKDVSRLCNLIIVTGGLGPTDDDLTRQAIASYLEVELEFNEGILYTINEFFKERGKTMAPKNRTQAYIPAGAQVLDNPLGTAPGFWSQKDDVCITAVPGVPSEMKHMFTEQVVHRIKAFYKGPIVASGQLRCFGAGESDIAQKLGDLMERGRNPLINCTCGSGDIVLHIIATAEDKEAANEMIEKDKKLLHGQLGELIYGQNDQNLAVVVCELLKKNRKTIALAESCTGGLLSRMLTGIPGASDFFLAGWVTYSNEAKIKQLGIPEEIINKYGAVSEPVARMMAAQSSKKSSSDIGVGITGIAGPDGGTEEKPVGLVYIAVQIDDKCNVREYRFPPTGRQWVRLRSALTALNMVRLQFKV